MFTEALSCLKKLFWQLRLFSATEYKMTGNTARIHVANRYSCSPLSEYFPVAYPVVHIDWDLPTQGEGPPDGTRTSSSAALTPHAAAPAPLFPPVAQSNTGGDFKKSCSSDALLMSASNEDSGNCSSSSSTNSSNKNASKKHQHQRVFRPMREDALGPSVHVQQGKFEKINNIFYNICGKCVYGTRRKLGSLPPHCSSHLSKQLSQTPVRGRAVWFIFPLPFFLRETMSGETGAISDSR